MVRWIRSGAAPITPDAGLAVAGDSAGGSIAALTCLWLRDVGEEQPDLQALAYADLDLTLAQPSMESNGHGWGFDLEDPAGMPSNGFPTRAGAATPG